MIRNQEKLNILLLNMANYREWQKGVVNRNYFILKNLLNDPRVGRVLSVDFVPFGGPPPFGLKRAVKYWFQNVLSGPSGAHRKGDATSLLSKIDDKLFVYSSADLYLSPKIFRSKLEISMASAFPDGKLLVWNYNPFFADLTEKLRADFKVFDMVDDWCEHASLNACRNLLKKNYSVIGKSADLIFTVARESLDYFGERPDVLWMPNGVETGHFQQEKPVPSDLVKLKRPIIGYVGTIQERLDFDLLRYLAAANQDKSIVMVGPVWDGVRPEIAEKLSDFPNVVFTGRRPYQLSPAYIRQFDAAIIPHKIQRFIKSTNPMKMYEYLACGRPVVSTPGAGVDMFSQFVAVADTPEEFNRQVQLALHSDSAERRAARQAAVRPHSWGSRVTEMLDIISKRLYP